jgi:hypothetical protein
MSTINADGVVIARPSDYGGHLGGDSVSREHQVIEPPAMMVREGSDSSEKW